MAGRGWDAWDNCAPFARDAWEEGTGEALDAGFLPSPNGLGDSIDNANDADGLNGPPGQLDNLHFPLLFP